MKIINYRFRHIVTAQQFNQAYYEATRYNINSVGPLITRGLDITTSGLSITVTKGAGFCAEVSLPFIYNRATTTTDFNNSNMYNPAVVLQADTTLALNANTTTYLVLRSMIDSTTAYQDSYTTTDSLLLTATPTAVFPTGNIIGELVIGQITTDATSVINFTPIAPSIGGLSTLLPRIVALEILVASIASQQLIPVQYDAVLDLPSLAGETLTTLKKKLIFVKNDGNVNIAGTFYNVWNGDIITSDGTQLIINHQNFWS